MCEENQAGARSSRSFCRKPSAGEAVPGLVPDASRREGRSPLHLCERGRGWEAEHLHRCHGLLGQGARNEAWGASFRGPGLKVGFRQGVGIQNVKDINVGRWTLFPPGTVFLGTLALIDASARRGWSTPPHFQAQQGTHFNGSLGAVHVEQDMERRIFMAAKSQRLRTSNVAAAKCRRPENLGVMWDYGPRAFAPESIPAGLPGTIDLVGSR